MKKIIKTLIISATLGPLLFIIFAVMISMSVINGFDYFASEEVVENNETKTVEGTSFLLPVESATFTNPYGFEGYDVTGGGFHPGVDLANAVGTPIYPSAPGVVMRVESTATGYGNYVVIEHLINNNTYTTLYAHLNTTIVYIGQQVTTDTQIGTMGSTGASTGPHVHFSINSGSGVESYSNIPGRFINPDEYLILPEVGQIAQRYTLSPESGLDTTTQSNIELMSSAGISETDYTYVNFIITKESSWNITANNPNSSAYGLCQALPGNKMASAGDDYMTNGVTQLKWCNTYATERYGSWEEAYNFWIANNWW